MTDWQEIEDILPEDSDCGSPAEAHGLLTGLLCMESGLQAERWLEMTLGPAAESLSPLALAEWIRLFKETRRQLEDFDCSFTPLLPDDETDLDERADALGEWCRGFLLGLGYGSDHAQWPEQSAELLRDFVEFTKLDTQASGEEDEAAYAEIVEYVRVGVQIILRELRSRPSQRLH